MSAIMLTKEETEKFRKLQKLFHSFAAAGWMCESPDSNVLVFFNNTDEDVAVRSDFNGNISSCEGVGLGYARRMVDAYLPSFRLANRM